MNVNDEILKQLREPLSEKQVSWRVGATNADKTRGQALPYIDNRIVQNRLDDVVGPSNWKNRYEEVIVDNRLLAVRCIISVKTDGEWVDKEDAAHLDESSTSSNARELAGKGVYSDAMKRAAVQWGIGRYLYDYAAPWVALDEKGRLGEIPRLPAHMLPAAEAKNAAAPSPAKAPAPKTSEAPAPAQATKPVAAPAPKTAEAPAAPAPAPAPVDAPAPVEAPAPSAQSAQASVLQPGAEHDRADALVDAAVARTSNVTSVAAPAADEQGSADSGSDEMPADMTAEMKALVDDLLAKIEKLPPKMIRAYITGPKGQDKLSAAARDFLLKKVSAKEAAAEAA